MLIFDAKKTLDSLIFTGIVAAGLWLFLYGFWSPEAWPATESPPKQGEAVDAESLAAGSAVHSASALLQVVREPQNTWSNLAYVLVGALIGTCFPSRLLRGLAISLIGVGIGSFLYHASASRFLRAFDVGAMYWFYGHLVLYAFACLSPRLSNWCERWAITITCGMLILSLFVTLNRNMKIGDVKPLSISVVTGAVALVLCLALLTRAIQMRHWSAWIWPIGGLTTFAIAALLQIGDRPYGWCCDPGALLQGHAVWHLLSATACGMAVLGLANPAPISFPERVL